MENSMKTDISITVKRTEDSGYRGNMYLGFAALFCGVLSVLLFISGFNVIGYTGGTCVSVCVFCYLLYSVMCITINHNCQLYYA